MESTTIGLHNIKSQGPCLILAARKVGVYLPLVLLEQIVRLATERATFALELAGTGIDELTTPCADGAPTRPGQPRIPGHLGWGPTGTCCYEPDYGRGRV